MSTIAAPAAAERVVRAERALPLAWMADRGIPASVLIASISSFFGVALMVITNYMTELVRASSVGGRDSVQLTLTILAWLFIAIAMYVAAIVTANTFATIIAGRTRQIALMRLIGATARAERNRIAGQGLVIGLVGAILGWIIAVAASLAVYPYANAWIGVPSSFSFTVFTVNTVLPPLAVILATLASAWVGSRRVLTVTPLQALGGAVARSADETNKMPKRVSAIVLLLIGAALLALGVVMGLVSPMGVVIAFFGGLFSFTGLALGSTIVMPPILRLIGQLFGKSATAKLAAENALRYPERSSRMSIGVVMGVTLVTMFAVAASSVKTVLLGAPENDVQFRGEIAQFLDNLSMIMMVLVGISAVIAAVGLVNLLTISIVQRTRELGLLRALGLTKTQIRNMVILEAAHIAIASLATGLVLGIIYGWAAAQSTLGSLRIGGDATLVFPTVPWPLVLGVIAATVVLTLVASVVPTRLATRVVPVEALAAD